MSTYRTILASVATLIAVPSFAADHGIAVSLGTFENADEQYQLFNTGNHMVQVGLRGEYAIHDRFAVVGSIRTHRTGQTVTSGEEYTGAQSFVAAYSANTAGVGLKADVETFKGVLQGYVATQALLYHATMRLDDDGNSRTNAGQVQSSSISAGFEATAGIELKVSPKKLPVSFGWFNEVGVGLIANHSYRGAKDVNGTEESFASDAYLGDMMPGGLVFRSGLGVRF